MSNENEERRYAPRFARTVEDLVFYTDTSQKDYPVYLTSNFEVRIKKRPEGEKFAVFHVKDLAVVEWYDGGFSRLAGLIPFDGKKMGLEEYVNSYPQLPLKPLFDVAAELRANIHVRTLQVTYEVYRGDYEELIGEAEATVVAVYIRPPYSEQAAENQKFAITHSTRKRLLSKLPPDVASQVDRIAYIDKVFGRRVGTLPFIKVKFCLPSQELARAFDEVKKYLEGRDEVVETVSEAEGEERAPVEIPDLEVKPQELELELEPIAPATVPTVQMPTVQTAVPTAVVTAPPAPAKAELVKVYLLAMKLPSKYLVQQVKIEENVEIRKWEGVAVDVASRLESIRRKCYAMIEKAFAHIGEYGVWIAVSEEAIEEVREVSEYVRSELSCLPQLRQVKDVDLDAYSVKAIPVYLEPEDAKELLRAAVRHLSEDVEELEARIKKAEEEQKKQALLRLQQSLEYKRALLDAFKRFLERLS